jgi:hypothetical protein
MARICEDRASLAEMQRIGRATRNSAVDKPDLDDYMALFNQYGRDFGAAYLEPEDERFRFLFDQICRLLAQPSQFNLGLPEPFRTTSHRYLSGDEVTVAHMRIVENRHFMLSDLFDYLHLCQRLGKSTS